MARLRAWAQDFSSDPEWARLASEDERWRDRWIEDVLAGMAQRPERERRVDARRMIRTELELSDEELTAMTLGRFRAWLRLAPRDAAAVASAAEAVERFDIAGPDAMRLHDAAARALRRLSWRQLDQLARVAPWLADLVTRERRRRPAPNPLVRMLARLLPWVDAPPPRPSAR